MKKITFIALTLIITTSCSQNLIQVFETNSLNTQETDGFWVFENDTIRVVYSFWASNGIMSFYVYNKLGKPIYIDWKNSSYIEGSRKFDYWIDEEKESYSSYYGSYFYSGPLISPGLAISGGVQKGTSTRTKPERITFVPPKSYAVKSQFNLMPVPYFKIGKNTASKKIVSRNDKPRKNTAVYEIKYDYLNSPLRFRNYLAISFSEKSDNFFFTDHEFYLSSVKVMDYRHFRGKIISSTGTSFEYEKPFQNNKSFYIKIR